MSNEYQNFNEAMTAILRANPKAVGAAVEAEKKAKERSASDHAASAKGD